MSTINPTPPGRSRAHGPGPGGLTGPGGLLGVGSRRCGGGGCRGGGAGGGGGGTGGGGGGGGGSGVMGRGPGGWRRRRGSKQAGMKTGRWRRTCFPRGWKPSSEGQVNATSRT